MNKIYLLSIDSTLKTFAVIDGGVGVRYERNEQFGDTEIAVNDILLGFVSQGVNEFRSSYRVLSVDEESIELEKEVERAVGISIDMFLPQLATAFTELLSGKELVEAEQEVSTMIHDMLLGRSKTVVKIPSIGSWQLITYGAPGTGKSHKTKLETDAWKKNVFRTTFHPDSDYSTFVGAYKPTMSENAGRVEVYKGSGPSKVLDATQEVKQGISYEFVAQAFVKAYVLAWQKMAVASDDESGKPKPEPVFLVIEEINRGNCAQIFGDLFQLLDRNDAGYSEYPVDADADLRKFLGQKKAAAENEAKGLGDIDANALATRYGIETDLAKAIVEGRNLVLPPNLLIRATMNTSDQSLFPIDSAFKRRWDWEYVPISEPDVAKKRKIVCSWGDGEAHVVKRFDWWTFLDQFINKEILKTTKSEDKQLGYFFVKAPDESGEITASKFASKVLFYLYNDVFKDYNYPASVFERKSGTKEKFKFRDFFDAKGKVKDEVVAEFLENLGLVADASEEGGEAEGVAPTAEPA